MKTSWVSRLLIALGVLLALGVAAGVWLVATFDPNAYKGVAIDWMKTKKDRTLVIEGPIKLSVFPRLEVELSQVSLSEKGKADTFVSLQQAALAVQVWPLLRRQLVVDRVSAQGVRLNYLRDKNGKGNIDDLTSPDPAAAQDSSSQPLRFDVSAIRLDDVVLHVRDDFGQFAGDVSLRSLSTGRIADGVESPVKLDAELALQMPAVKGALSGTTQLTLQLADKALRLRDMNLAWRGDAMGATGITATLKGSLAQGGGMLQVDDFDLDFGARYGDMQLADSRVVVKVFLFDPAKKNLALTQLQVKLAGTQAKNPLSLVLDWPELSVNPASLNGSALTGRFTLGGPTALDASFKSGAPQGSFELVTVPQFETTLKGSQGARQIAGTLRADLRLKPADKSLAVEGLGGQIKLQEPSLQPMDVALQGTARASAQAASWALQGQINANPFQVNGEAALASKPRQLKLDARFAALDLNRLLLPPREGAAEAAPAASAPGADAPIDLSPLRAFDGQFDLRVGRFAYRDYRLDDLVFDGRLDAGLLRVSKLAGKGWGGTLDATGSINARDNRVAFKAVASNVNVNALLNTVAKYDKLEGTGRVTADLRTQGASVQAMKTQLDGTAALQLRDGAFKGVNLARALRQARAALSLKQDAVEQARATEKTDFSELTASFVIENGVARNQDLDMKSPFLRLSGGGQADIGRGQLDYTARATVAATSKGQDGAELAALKGLTVPVRLTGPLDAPQWKIQWSSVGGALVDAKVDEAKDKLKSRLDEKLRDKLGLPAPAAAASGASAPAAATSTRDEVKQQLKDKLKGLLK
jgi:AsmA protein